MLENCCSVTQLLSTDPRLSKVSLFVEMLSTYLIADKYVELPMFRF